MEAPTPAEQPMSADTGVEELSPVSAEGRTVADGGVGVLSGRRAAEPLSVAVIVDLFQSPEAGGHVKTWEKIAQAACGEPVDLTVYFFGPQERRVPLAENVRYVNLRPMWSTERLPFLRGIPAHTDLAPLHLGALKRLRRHRVLHATDAYFSMARAARALSRRSSRALVHSTHTDTPGYTRIYTEQVLRRGFGEGWAGRVLRERWKVPERMERRMQRRLESYLRCCDWAWVGAGDEKAARLGGNGVGAERASLLRRGVDREMFHPARRDRQRLARAFGIPPEDFVLLFAGRIDEGKDVLTLAGAARILLERGLPLHVICAGAGSQSQRVKELLGERVTLPGQVSQDELAWLYASADLFVFCSRIEVFPNVIVEAKASGLPVVVSSQGGTAKLVRLLPGEDAGGAVVSGGQSADWAREIEALLRAPERRRAMGENARRFIERNWPSWRQVLQEDLLPVWRRVARERGLRA